MSYHDIKCPYCGAEQDINHDDGYGYDEEDVYEQECPECGKTFCYLTHILFDYDAWEAPCKNNGEHVWKQIIGWPEEVFVGRFRCDCCGEERTDDTPERQSALKSLQEKMGKGKL